MPDPSPSSNPFAADPLFAGLPTERLDSAAQGCTEETCLYHGRINRERNRRRRTTETPTSASGAESRQQ